MEHLDLTQIKKKIKKLAKNKTKNYNELLEIYQQLLHRYYYLRKIST
jgi:hypothetical protein